MRSSFCNLKKLPKVNCDPMGENSPNLVTLVWGYQALFCAMYISTTSYICT
jgi:hypothetical protein